MKPFYNHLIEIHNEIRVDDQDRESFTKMYDDIRDWLLNRMCAVDKVFNSLYKGTVLFGSHTNNVRLYKPDEYDVLFRLDIPCSNEIIYELDEDRRGFVKFNLTDSMVDLENNGNVCVFNKFNNSLCDWNNNYLRRTSLQGWIRAIIDYVLENYNHWKYELYYEKRGLAHTIKAKEKNYPHREISIDFVPAIQVPKLKWMHVRTYPPFNSDDSEIHYNFYAVPKPFGSNNIYAFQLVNPEAERKLLWNKQNLKIVFRLMKAFRNSYKLHCIKSYFLTTVFLWEVQRRKAHFWQYPVAEIFVHIMEKLRDYFINKNLPYFWVRDLNLLYTMAAADICEYAETLKRCCNMFKSYLLEPNLTYERTCTRFKLPYDDSSDEDDEYSDEHDDYLDEDDEYSDEDDEYSDEDDEYSDEDDEYSDEDDEYSDEDDGYSD